MYEYRSIDLSGATAVRLICVLVFVFVKLVNPR
jgi:hypothetical protein